MPILHKQPLGDKEVTLLLFGTGDIKIFPGVDYSHNALFFAQDVEKPVEDWNLHKELVDDGSRFTTDEIEGEMVQFSFERTESIDVIIEALNFIKSNMNAQKS